MELSNNDKIDDIIWSLKKRKIKISKPCWSDLYEDCFKLNEEEFNERVRTVRGYIAQLRVLRQIPYVEQGSEEWFQMRKSMLTASDTMRAMKKDSNLIRQKSLQIVRHIKSDALTWGKNFESIAQNIYSSEMNGINIYEFGCIRSNDPELEFYGASPDGITSTGIMLEIKCPKSRKIKPNNISPDYYAQVQGQMAVCGLNECDFSEFEFQKMDVSSFLTIDTKDTKYFGAFLKNIHNEDKVDYYTPLSLTPLECFLSVKSNNPNNLKKVVYWKLNKHQIQRIRFNKKEWEYEYKPKIIEFWECVQKYDENEIYGFGSDSD